MKPLQELIIKTVNERYETEVAFYEVVGLNLSRWTDFKTGKTDIDRMGYGRVEKMKSVLFTPFEMHLFKETQFDKSTYANKYKDVTFIERYNERKLEVVKDMGENLIASIGMTRISKDGVANNIMYIKDETCPYVEMIFKNISAPAGKRNRREYILDNLERLI